MFRLLEIGARSPLDTSNKNWRGSNFWEAATWGVSDRKPSTEDEHLTFETDENWAEGIWITFTWKAMPRCEFFLCKITVHASRLKDFAKQYDIIKSERNKYVNQIQTSTQKAAEMREKIKVLENEIEIQRTTATQKDRWVLWWCLRHEKINRSKNRFYLNFDPPDHKEGEGKWTPPWPLRTTSRPPPNCSWSSW